MQNIQDDRPPGEKDPAEQARQAERPVEGAYVPVAQGKELLNPVVLQKLPAGQARGALMPVVGQYDLVEQTCPLSSPPGL